MSATSLYSLASTQDDVDSIEWGVSTAASYNTEDEAALLHRGMPITPPLAYEDDDEEDEEVEVARRDATATRHVTVGEEFTARVHELLHESKATLKADRVFDEAEEDEPRMDSEEEGVATAHEIGEESAVPSPGAAAPHPPTPRRPVMRGNINSGCGGLPPTPRPTTGRMRLPQPPPFFGGPAHHRPMYGGGSFHPPGPFGPLGYGGPSMRPFNSLPMPPHLSGGGMGRPLHLGVPPLPPRAYMGGSPPSNLGAGIGGRLYAGPPGARAGGYQGPAHFAGQHPPPPFPHHHHYGHHHQHLQSHLSFSPPSSVVYGGERRTAATTPRRDSETSPREGRATSTSVLSTVSESPRTAPVSLERSAPRGRNLQQGLSPTMASLGIGHAAVSSMTSSAIGGGAELTPYPLVYVSPAGSISCVLNQDVVVEMAVDRSVRVVLHDNFAAFCNSRGTSSAILHPTARIVHTEDYVYTKFIANNEKMAVFGEQGVLFTMSHLPEAYLVNSVAYPGASAVALDQLQFPAMDDDFTIKMFYTEAQTGQQFIALCKDIVSEATYDRRPDGSLYLHINGMLIRQSTSGDVIIDARPRQISCSPAKKSIHVRSGCIDMAVEEDERGYVKRAHKRVHVSRSGMVISDGNVITSMDHFGRIVCCN